ncbi:MAG TPA: hypothetical protein VKV32_11255, partial [Stellaceae bacterium]|nr:hypothetical protein [Stellaceae bacterium]
MPNAGTRIKVPVADVMAEAYRSVFGQLSRLLDLAWLPLLLVIAATILPGYLRVYQRLPGLPAWSGDPFGLSFENLGEALIALLCLSAFAVRWYQSLLFRGSRQPPRGMFLGGWLRFLAYMLLLYFVAALLLTVMLLADSDGAPPWLAPVLGAGIFAAWLAPVRCSLVFPAAAIGKPLSLSGAWQALGGNTWRLFATVMLVSVPTVFIVAMILSAIFAGFHLDGSEDAPPLGFFLLRGVIGSCADFLVVALGVAVVGSFYRRLKLDLRSD